MTEALHSIYKYKYTRLAAGGRGWLYRYVGKNARVIFEMWKNNPVSHLPHALACNPLPSSLWPRRAEHRASKQAAGWRGVAAPLCSLQGRAPIPSTGAHEGCSEQVWKMLLSQALSRFSLNHIPPPNRNKQIRKIPLKRSDNNNNNKTDGT